MGLEMIHAIPVGGVHKGLADIVQKHGKPKDPVGGDVVHAFTDVGVNVPAMVRVVLCKVKTRLKLGDKYRHNITVFDQYPCRVFSAKELFKLCGDTLCGYVFQKLFLTVDSKRGVFFYLKIKHRGKTHCPQDTQSVLVKALSWVADASDDAVL